MQKKINTRWLAARLFRRVIGKNSVLDIAVQAEPVIESLSFSDRGFVLTMCKESLRYGHKLKRASQPFLSRPWDEIEAQVADLLLIGLCQIWVLGTPSHAAVSQTVEAAKTNPHTKKAAGLINAVLRKAANNRDGFDRLPSASMLPDWLNLALTAHYGAEGVDKFAPNLDQPDRLHLTAKSVSTAETLTKQGFEASEGLTLFSAEGQTDPLKLLGFDAGGYWVQNVSAALPARLLNLQAGQAVLDLCAAPGGKSMQMAASGAKVTAIDFAKSRLKRMEENVQRLQMREQIELVQADIFKWKPHQTYKKILLDAPCTALGTIRRHPESLWIKFHGDVERNAKRQFRMLEHAMQFLEPEGHLVYCVCSPLYEEGKAVIDQAVKAGIARRAQITTDEVGIFSDCVTPDGDVHILGVEAVPDADAFFVARLMHPLSG